MAGYLYIASTPDNKIYQHSGFSSTSLGFIATPSSNISGISSNGSYIYSCDSGENKIYKHSGYSTTILDSFSSPSSNSSGVAWDGTNILSSNLTSPACIYKHSGFSSTIGDTFGQSYCLGLEWDGENTLNIGLDPSFTKYWASKFSGFSDTILDTFLCAGTFPEDVAWDGTNSLITSLNPIIIYKYSGFSSTILDTFLNDRQANRITWEEITTTSTTSTSTTSTTTSTTTTLDPNGHALIFGEENPTEGETKVAWPTFDDGATGAVTVIGDANWGKLQLSGNDEARSAVYDFSNANNRGYRLTENEYGSGQGDATLQIRGSADSFEQDDGEVGPASLISADSTSDKVYKYNGFSDEVTDSFAISDSDVRGLDNDSGNVLIAGSGEQWIYKQSGFSATISDTFSTKSFGVGGVTIDNNNDIIYQCYLGINPWIYKCDGFSAVITDSFDCVETNAALSWYDGCLYMADNTNNVIYKHSGFSTTIVDSIAVDSDKGVKVLADYTYGVSSSKAYQYSGFSTTVLDSFTTPGSNNFGASWIPGGAPAWENYTTEIFREWRYVQIRETKT